jgi:4-hydroxybenzoate polyprenyltransferase
VVAAVRQHWLHDAHNFWRISRVPNLGIALLTYGVAAWLTLARNWGFLTDERFWLEALCLILIMAGGYWINDVYDFKIDRINKPTRALINAHLSRKKVVTGYALLTGMALLTSIWLPRKLLLLNAIAVGALLAYAALFKPKAVLGNLIVSSLAAAVGGAAILLYGPRLSVIWMMAFAFWMTFLREVTKDVEDIRGDLLFGLKTLPILVGIRQSKRLLIAGYALLLGLCYAPVVMEPLLHRPFPIWYLLFSIVIVQAPIIATVVLLRYSYKPAQFGKQSQQLKWIMLTGLVTLALL